MTPNNFKQYVIDMYGKYPNNYKLTDSENEEYYKLTIQVERILNFALTIPEGDPRRKDLNNELTPLNRRRTQIIRNRILKVAEANWKRAQSRNKYK